MAILLENESAVQIQSGDTDEVPRELRGTSAAKSQASALVAEPLRLAVAKFATAATGTICGRSHFST